MIRLIVEIHGWTYRVWHDRSGQDMIEYALMAAMVAIPCAAFLPPVTPALSNVYGRIISLLSAFGGGA